MKGKLRRLIDYLSRRAGNPFNCCENCGHALPIHFESCDACGSEKFDPNGPFIPMRIDVDGNLFEKAG